MWNPKYKISDRLLATIKEVTKYLTIIEGYHLDGKAFAKLEITAKAISTHASTSIEGNPLALTDVKRILKTSPKFIRDTQKEVLNYNKALNRIYARVSEGTFSLSINELKTVQALAVSELMTYSKDEGTIRTDPVIIRSPSDANQILFIPPDVKDVSILLEDLITFINANLDTIDPIILAGLFHRQHVIIHPFMDGNGRTTRLITTALLGQTGIDLFKIFSFENYYNQNVTKYFQKVGAFGDYYDVAQELEHTEWLEYFAEGVLDELIRVDNLIKHEKRTHQRLEAHHELILDHIRAKGSITQKEYGSITDRSLSSRKKDFAYLINLNLIKSNGGGRNIYYTLVDT